MGAAAGEGSVYAKSRSTQEKLNTYALHFEKNAIADMIQVSKVQANVSKV
jgi:hypothetical protein